MWLNLKDELNVIVIATFLVLDMTSVVQIFHCDYFGSKTDRKLTDSKNQGVKRSLVTEAKELLLPLLDVWKILRI